MPPVSPHASIWHRGPRFHRWERRTLLKQLDGNTVRRTHERHVPIAWRPVDDDTAIHQFPAGRVDISHAIREMAEIAPAGIDFLVPIMGEFHHGRLLARGLLRI